MAVDKGYGSGKSRSAANSAARRRAAEGKMTKGKKGIASKIKAANTARANSPLGQIADTVLGFALPVGKVKAAANAARMAGRGLYPTTLALGSRVLAKETGRAAAKSIAQSSYLQNAASRELAPLARMIGSQIKADAKAAGFVSRASARRVFPQVARQEAEARVLKAQAAAAKRANRNR